MARQIYQIATTVTKAGLADADWLPADRDSDKETVKYTLGNLSEYVRERLTLLQSSQFLVNTSETEVDINGSLASPSILNVTEDSTLHNFLVGYNDSLGTYGALDLAKARGTEATPTSTTTNDILGAIRFRGYNTSFWGAAYIAAYADAATTTTYAPGRLQFNVTSSTGVFTDALTLKATGSGFYTTNPQDLLHVYGNDSTAVRVRIQNIDAGSNKSAGILSVNGNKNIYTGISASGGVDHWTVFDNTSNLSCLRYDITNDGLIVGSFGNSKITSLFELNSSNKPVKFYSEYGSSTTIGQVIVNHGNGNPASIGGAVSNGLPGFPQIVLDGQTSLQLAGYGYDGVTYRPMGVAQFEVDGTPGSGDMPGSFVIYTTPDGSTTPSQVVNFNALQEAVFSVGIRLPTSGGTASLLNNYEEYSYTMACSSNLFGATDLNLPLRITRNGRIVNISWNGVTVSQAGGSGNDYIYTKAGSELPSRFRPSILVNKVVNYFINGANNTNGVVDVRPTGILNISLIVSGNAFTWGSGSTFTIYAGSITYTI